MRMARVNITIPDELVARAKEAELNISKLARDAIVEALDRLYKTAAVDRYLAELEAELGPISPAERARVDAIMDQAYGPDDVRQSA